MSLQETSAPLPPPPRIWRFGNAELDEGLRTLRVDGQPRAIEAKPLAILGALLTQRGEVVTKDALKAAVWPDVEVVEQSLTTAVSKLRAALADDNWTIIRAVRGKGYQIGVPVTVQSGAQPGPPAFDLTLGATISGRPHWQLERPLGSDVWLACHEGTRERRVFKFAGFSPSRLGALKREVALSHILHAALGDWPGLLRVRECNSGVSPFSIESVFGGLNLADWAAAQGGLAAVPLAERVAVVARVAHIVAAAHGVGVLHCDIKPSNILVDDDGGGRTIRLVNFGAGRLTGMARITSVMMTGTGPDDGVAGQPRSRGTWHDVAPETLGDEASTTASDLYALGILLYQMVASDLNRPLAAGWEADIADPALRADITETATADPARRLASAETMAKRLEELGQRGDQRRLQELQAAEHEELLRLGEDRRLDVAMAAGRAELATHLARRTRRVAIVVSLLLALAGASSLYALKQRELAAAQRNRADQITGAARDAVMGLVNDTAVGVRDQAGGSMAVVQKVLGGAESIVTSLMGLAPEDFELSRLRARALAEFADTYLHQGNLPQALDAAQRAVAMQEALVGAQPGHPTLRRELAQSLRWVGDVRLKQHDFPDALAAYASAAEITTQLLAADPQNPDLQRRETYTELAVGDVQLQQGNSQGALATYRHVQTTIAQGLAGHQDDPEWQLTLSIAQEKVGDALEALGDPAGALAAYQADLAIRQHVVSRDPGNTRWKRDLAIAHADVGGDWALLGKPADALEWYRTALALVRDLAAADPGSAQFQGDVADDLNYIGNAEADLGDQAAAAKSFGEGVGIMQQLVANSFTNVEAQQELMTLETGLTKSLLKGGDAPAAAFYAAKMLETANELASAHPLDAALANSLAAAQALAEQTRSAE